MSDFLRITTPLVNKNQNVQPKPGPEPIEAFNIQNPVKVIQAHNQSELLKQNNGLRDENDAPALLLNLLKDPSVTVSYLKNLFVLEEIAKLIPANNKTVTHEIENIIDSLLLNPEGLSREMRNQEYSSTTFKGEIFDFLRTLCDNNADKPEVQVAVAKFLRTLYSSGNQREILDSACNNLLYLRGELSASKVLSEKLDKLIDGFNSEDAQDNFQSLKAETMALVKEIEQSILFSPKQAKILSILVYNLSRYNTSPSSLMEAAYRLRHYLSGEERFYFNKLFESYTLHKYEALDSEKVQESKESSRVVTMLVDLISKQMDTDKMSVSEWMKMQAMLQSMLSSPCNFTPLLHFILPLQYEAMKAFAEVWINPNSDEKDMPPEANGSGIHILMVIDIDGVGRFEVEFFVYRNIVDIVLFCPQGCEQAYEELAKNLPDLLSGTKYFVGRAKVVPLEKTRSLMDVFKSLPYRRVGVDVKI